MLDAQRRAYLLASFSQPLTLTNGNWVRSGDPANFTRDKWMKLLKIASQWDMEKVRRLFHQLTERVVLNSAGDQRVRLVQTDPGLCN